MKKIFLPIILFIAIIDSMYCQNLFKSFKSDDFFIEGGLRYGSAIYHPKHDYYLKDLYFGSIELRFGKQASGKQQWEQMLNFPLYGIALRYTDYTDFFDSPDVIKERNKVIGKNIALFGYLQGSIFRYKCFNWHYQFGMGMTYFTKIYDPNNTYNIPSDDPEINDFPDNDMISLYLNPYVNLQMGFDFKVDKQIDLCFNANFNHTSNANMNMPNYGINEVQGIASIRYHFNPNHAIEKNNSFPKYHQKNYLFFTFDPGWLFARYDDNYWLKLGTSIGYMRNILPILNVGASFEFCYVRYLSHSFDFNEERWNNAFQNPNDAIAVGINPKNPDIPILMPKNIFTGAIFGFAELTFSRFAFQVGVGCYVAKGPDQAKYMDLAQNWNNGGTLKNYPYVYEKLGFRIYLGNDMRHFVGASIRAHLPVADYLAFNYGFKFYKF